MNKKRTSKIPSADRVVFISFLVDVSDLLINLIVAVLSGSVVMMSQALQGGSDLLSSTLLLIGVQRSKKMNDKAYPFGNGRELYFWNMMAAMAMLGITATLSIFFGIQRINKPEPIDNVWLSLAILFLAILTNSYSFYLSAVRLLKGKKINTYFKTLKNSPFVEIKTVFVQDLMGAAASFVGIIALILYTITGDLRFDGLGALMIGIILASLSIFLLDGIRQMIIGRSASDAMVDRIKHATLKLPEVEEILDLKTIYFGPNKLLINIEVHVVEKLKTQQLEKLIDNIKANIKEEIKLDAHIQVELETPAK